MKTKQQFYQKYAHAKDVCMHDALVNLNFSIIRDALKIETMSEDEDALRPLFYKLVNACLDRLSRDLPEDEEEGFRWPSNSRPVDLCPASDPTE